MPISSIEYPRRSVYHTGIGGAGNYRRISYLELETAPQPKPVNSIPQARPFFGGRGGIGNSYSASERAIFSFDEELVRDKQTREHAAPIYSIGRGGAGNFVQYEEKQTKQQRKPDPYVYMPPFLASFSSRRTSTNSRYSTSSGSSDSDKPIPKYKAFEK